MSLHHQIQRSEASERPKPVSLPDMITKAAQRLAAARNSAEVLEAHAAASAALHYAKVTEAANETHADCLRIITRAEIRMANELDAGRKSGAVEGHGGDRKIKARAPGVDQATLGDLNISSQRASEWRKTRDAGEEKVDAAIQSAVDQGRAPTKTAVLESIGATKPRTAKSHQPATPKGLTDEQKFARFISLADEMEALDVPAVARGAGRKLAVLRQRASSLVGVINRILEAEA